jgi:hypothetical protein
MAQMTGGEVYNRPAGQGGASGGTLILCLLDQYRNQMFRAKLHQRDRVQLRCWTSLDSSIVV